MMSGGEELKLKAIETSYRGFRFRSRTEARWAVFFDALGIEWSYEEEGFDLDGIWYLPDFWLPEWKCFIEIKGQSPTLLEREKAVRLAHKSGHPVVIISGQVGRECMMGCVTGKDVEGKAWHYEEDWGWKQCSNGCVGLGPWDPNELWFGANCDRDLCDCVTIFNIKPENAYSDRLLMACGLARSERFGT